MSKHSNRLIVVRTSDRSPRLVPYSANYGKWDAQPTEFTNMKDARAVQEKMAAGESRGRKWFVMRIEAEIAPVMTPVMANGDDDDETDNDNETDDDDETDNDNETDDDDETDNG